MSKGMSFSLFLASFRHSRSLQPLSTHCRYGNVTSVMIFEVTTPGYEAEEAVRIFIQFDRVESATKAQIDLQV